MTTDSAARVVDSNVGPRQVRTPSWPVLLATASALISLAIVGVELVADRDDDILLTSIGYVTGSIATAVFVVLHRLQKNRAQRNSWYAPRDALDTAAAAVLCVGLLAGAWHAFLLATEIAK